MKNAFLVTCRKSHYNASWWDLGDVAKSLEGFSIPVRVTMYVISKSRCYAVC